MNRVLGILILLAIVSVEVVTFFDLAPSTGRDDADMSMPRTLSSDRT
jgi:hypothetical protein